MGTTYVLALVKKNGERYVFRYTDDTAKEALKAMGRFACNSDLSFDWTDVAKCSERVDHRNVSSLGS